MLDARRLATLQAVFRTGSFAAAAQELGYTQSAISQQISELERAVGLRLLERRPVRPTEAGLVAARAADLAGTAIAAAATELRGLREGRAGHYVSRLRTRTTPAAVAALVEAIRSSA